ncbi:MAG: UvrD-helicase domain-containing protein [Rivularia sp. (in: cyanobacteria)]
MGQWIDFQQTYNKRLLREELDNEQNKARNYSVNGHSLVRGVAGSGKSLVLRSRVEKVLNEFDSVLILSYNRFMNGWLKSKLSKYNNRRNIECLTFHSWAYRNLGYDYRWDEDDEIRKEIIDLAQNSGIQYQAILIDEAQDFYDEWFQAVLQVLDKDTNSLFFVYDNTQSVYGKPHRRKSSWSWNKLGINVTGRSQIFDLNYRNTPEILETAWQFILPALARTDMKVEKRERGQDGKIIKTPGIGSIIEPKKKLSRSSSIKPLLVQIDYRKMSKEIAQQVQYALKSYKDSSIGILTHPQQRNLRLEISEELKQLGIPHLAPQYSRDRDGNVVDRPYVIVDSWNALKGVEFDAVILVGIDQILEYPYNSDKDFEEKAGLYTAMTRARDHLVMLYGIPNETVNLVENAVSFSIQLDSES